MLADVRQFGLEQAEKDGELHGLHQRHASWYAELGSRFDKEACGPHQADWLRRLRLEHANLRAAIEYFVGASGGAAAGLVMARELDLYWSASGLLDEARHWLDVGLASGAGTPQERAAAMAVAARFAVLQNDRLRARELVDEGTDVAALDDDARSLGLLLVPAAMLSVWDGTPAAAAEQADRAVALLRAAGLSARRADGAVRRRGLPRLRRQQSGIGRPASAVHRPRERGRRAVHMKALAVAGLGEQELAGGRLDEAAVLFREAIVLKQRAG